MKNRNRKPPKIEMPDSNSKERQQANEAQLEWLIQASDYFGQFVTDSMREDGWPTNVQDGQGWNTLAGATAYMACLCHDKAGAREPDPSRASERELAAGVRRHASTALQVAVYSMSVCKIMTDSRLTERERLQAAGRFCAMAAKAALGAMNAAACTDGEICSELSLKMNATVDPDDPTMAALLGMLRASGVELPKGATIADLQDALDRMDGRKDEA